MPTVTLLEPIVAYVHGVQYENLPPAVTERAVDIILDTVGCALGGVLTRPGAVEARVFKRLAGPGRATALGIARSVDPVSAVWLNANLADVLDYEDTIVGLGHPSTVVVPAALASGEIAGASGSEVVAAVVAGYEVGLRIGRAVLPSSERSKQVPVWQAWKAFGAVAAASKLLGLTANATLDAFGYAGAASPLPLWYTRLGRPAHWLKGNYGDQARAGVLGALMAQEGFRGPRRILDSDLGFWRMIGSDRYDPSKLTHELGIRYEILETHFKPYPTCHWLHTTVEAIGALVRREHLSPEDVEEVLVRSFHDITGWFDDPAPETLVDAEFSIPYAVAITLLNIPVGLAWYHTDTLHDPKLVALARRVRVETSEEANTGFQQGLYPVEVTIRTSRGATLKVVEKVPVGGPARPLTASQLEGKFVGLAEPVLGPALSREAWRSGRSLPSLGDVRSWTARLVRDELAGSPAAVPVFQPQAGR